jgi:Zn-dependent protease with chaperone function
MGKNLRCTSARSTWHEQIGIGAPMLVLFTMASFWGALLLGAFLNWMALIPWKRSAGAHWTERARQLFPARKAAGINVWLIAINIALSWQIFRDDTTSAWLGPAVAAWVGAAMSGYWMDQQLWPHLSFRRWSGQFLLYAMFWQVGLILMVITMFLMPARFTGQTWLIAGALAALLLSMVLGLTVALLQWLRLLQPAPARVAEIARKEAERAGAKLRSTLTNEGPMANAFALMPMNKMLFSDSLLKLLSDEELAAICAHEAAHLTESKWIFAGRVVGVFILFPLIFIRPALHQFELPGALALLAMTFALLLFYRWLGRKMEKRADAAAADRTGDSANYARALEKLYEANQIPAVMPKRNSLVHPDLYDRMLAVGVTPAYERPKPPRRAAWTPLFLYGLFIFQLIIMISQSDVHHGSDDRSQKRTPEGIETFRLSSEALTN